jgi:tetratricopeptide (TPR) repeat protein
MHHRPEAVDALQNSLKFETNRSYADDTKRLLAKITNGEDASGIVVPAAASSAPNTADAEKVSTLIDQKRWVQAEEMLHEMISRSGENPILYNNLGFALAHERTSSNSTDSYKKAIEAYKKAIALQKGPFPSANYNMGQAYRLLGDNRIAEATFRHAIIEAQSMRMSMPLAHNALGMLLKQRGAFEAADKEYRKALSQAGDDLPVVHYNLGLLLEKMGKGKQAAVEYGLYLSLAPNGLNVKQAKLRLNRLSQG